ncbi:MAG: hypothetical protein DSY59_04290 [Persephonella sp.]|nr:MAG: hypothetical protein DSY60_02170 [Persephonella sp.]RUM59562.1 MAG: hypothetical protein DSY59_04290 [Persephonella sp.]
MRGIPAGVEIKFIDGGLAYIPATADGIPLFVGYATGTAKAKEPLAITKDTDIVKLFGESKLTNYIYDFFSMGFRTDFASIPRILYPLIKDRDKFNKAAVVHDWLYYSQQFDRKTSDRIFLEAMEVVGISLWKRYLFYLVVRIFGWIRWKRRTTKTF